MMPKKETKNVNLIGNTDFLSRLKTLRKTKKLSQEKLAEELFNRYNVKISRISIARYEAGLRQPELNLLLYLADFFEVDLDYLAGMSDIPKKANKQKTSVHSDVMDFCLFLNAVAETSPHREWIFSMLESLKPILSTSELPVKGDEVYKLLHILCKTEPRN